MCLLAGCSKPSSSQATGSASSIASAAPPSAPAAPSSSLKLVLDAQSAISIVAGPEGALLESDGMLYRLTGKALTQDLELEQGLYPMHYWSNVQLVGAWPDAAFWTGDKLDPRADSEAQPAVAFMRHFKAAWGNATNLAEGEKLGGIGAYKDGRFVAAIRMASGKDYRLALVGGKPGVVMPLPQAAPKPETDAGTPAPTASVSPAASAAPPTDAGPVADAAPPAAPAPAAAVPEVDPNACQTRILPLAAAGHDSGAFLIVGQDCEHSNVLAVERWAAGSRKSQIEMLPELTTTGDGDHFLVAVQNEHSAFVAKANTDYLAHFDGTHWVKEPAPGGEISALGANSTATWLVTSGGAYTRGATGWDLVVLPKLDSELHPAAMAVVGSDIYVAGRAGSNHVLVATQAPDAPFHLPTRYSPKTSREEIPSASSACATPFVIVRNNVKKTEKFDDTKTSVSDPAFAGAELVVDGWKNGTLLGVKVTSYAQGQALVNKLGGAARLSCHVPNVIATP
jgi:hypothetical protein